MLLISQDRDQAVEFIPGGETIRPEIVGHNSRFMGVNLVYKGILLGTFDSLPEALREMKAIQEWELDYYIVSGYSEWHEWESIQRVMIS